MKIAKPGRYEYEVEAELLHVFRKHGSPRPAYGPIVGSGPNATVLHYRKNDRRMEDGELLLIDAGCEVDERVAVDVDDDASSGSLHIDRQAHADPVGNRCRLALMHGA